MSSNFKLVGLIVVLIYLSIIYFLISNAQNKLEKCIKIDSDQKMRIEALEDQNHRDTEIIKDLCSQIEEYRRSNK